jgi:penicillin amidase
VDPNINPSRVNPERGFIATANNKTVEDFPFDMNGTFAPRYRFDRIVGMLERGNPMDVAFMQKMQGDTTSMLARKMIPIMKEYVMVSDDPRAKKALELVTAWDGDVDEKRPEPSIYNTWLVRFMFHTFADELGQELAEQYVGQRYISLERFLVLLDKKSPFFDDVTTPERESARHIATRAFRETLRLLAECTGSREIKDWQWGNIHQIRFDHFLGKSKLMRPFVNCDPLPVKGDGETNHRAHFYEITPPFTAQLASGLRLIVEFDPEPKGQMILITGQNEYFLSSHYKDMTKLWTQGTYFCPEEWKARYVTTWSPGQSGG